MFSLSASPHADRYPARGEWDVRSLLRGERRTVAMRRAEQAQKFHPVKDFVLKDFVLCA